MFFQNTLLSFFNQQFIRLSVTEEPALPSPSAQLLYPRVASVCLSSRIKCRVLGFLCWALLTDVELWNLNGEVGLLLFLLLRIVMFLFLAQSIFMYSAFGWL